MEPIAPNGFWDLLGTKKAFVFRWVSYNNVIYPTFYSQIKKILAACIARDSSVENEA
jgi:hypothetical protein